jgi:hypothetical protein
MSWRDEWSNEDVEDEVLNYGGEDESPEEPDVEAEEEETGPDPEEEVQEVVEVEVPEPQGITYVRGPGGGLIPR